MMKKIFYYFILCCVILSCEDVIDVDLPPTETRLIVNAVFRVDITQEFIPVSVKVTETNGFFEENTVTQLDDNATLLYGIPDPNEPNSLDLILEGGGTSSLAETEPGSGIYEPDPSFDSDQRVSTSLATRPGTVFILILQHKGRRYVARTPYSPVVPIDNVEQGTETLFDEEDIEVLVTFTDTPDTDNFYVFDFDFNEFLALDDQFIDGQEFEFSYFYDKNLEVGDEVEVSILGADLQFFNYMDLLLEQTEDNGGVFETPAATVRGNVFDVTGINNDDLFDNVERPGNFPLGYFAVVQEFTQTITIE
jgi:hypothetical protein